MKIVKKSISLPKDVYDFAEKQAAAMAKERLEKPNISGYLRQLLLKQMNDPVKKAA